MRRIEDTLYDVIDQYTGELVTYNKVTTHFDGSPMTDDKCDGVIYRKLDTEYFRRAFTGPLNVEWFGAKGDGITDNTSSFQSAIDCASSNGLELIYIPAGTFYIATTSGAEEIDAHDDGTVLAGHGTVMSPEPVFSQNYCLKVPEKVKFQGEGSAKTYIKSDYIYGNAGLDQNIIFWIEDRYYYGFKGITFQNCFCAIGAFNTTIVTSLFDDLVFIACGLGVYARILEQCVFSNIISLATAATIVSGGQWHSRNDNYNELGGFIDKNCFINIRNNFDRIVGIAEQNIDTWFDTYFFKSINNTTRLSTPIQAGTVVTTSTQTYRGITGHTIIHYSRYSRASTSNVFLLINHANSTRPGIRVVSGVSSNISVVYFENVGYHDNIGRTEGVGDTYTDPYLGAGVRIPALIDGFDSSCTITDVQAQFVFTSYISTFAASSTIDRAPGSNVSNLRTKQTWVPDQKFKNAEFENILLTALTTVGTIPLITAYGATKGWDMFNTGSPVTRQQLRGFLSGSTNNITLDPGGVSALLKGLNVGEKLTVSGLTTVAAIVFETFYGATKGWDITNIGGVTNRQALRGYLSGVQTIQIDPTGGSSFNGIRNSIVTKTANYTATLADGAVLCNATIGALTMTLPIASQVPGLILTFKKTDSSANTVSVIGNGADVIDGIPTFVLYIQNDYVTVRSNGTTGWIVSAQYTELLSINNSDTAAPTKATLNTSYGTRRAGYRRAYTNITGGALLFTKLTDGNTGDWAQSSFTLAV